MKYLAGFLLGFVAAVVLFYGTIYVVFVLPY